MNHWTQLSIEYANQKSYLDDLFQVYPTITEKLKYLLTKEDIKHNLIEDFVDFRKELFKIDINQNHELFKLRKVLPVLKYLNSLYVIEEEKSTYQATMQAERFVESLSKDREYRFSKDFDMFKHLQKNKIRNMCLIGCGYFPETLFHFSSCQNIKEVLCIDVDSNALNASKILLGKIKYPRKILLQNINALDFKGFTNYDYFHIPPYVDKKQAILKRIIEQKKYDLENLQITVEVPKNAQRLFYTKVNLNPIKRQYGYSLNSKTKHIKHQYSDFDIKTLTYQKNAKLTPQI